MKAFLLFETGAPNKLVQGESPKPTIRQGEVLIKVKAIGINPADAKYRSSDLFINALFGHVRPAIIGWDISGEITEIAENVDGFEVGEPVFTLSPNAGGYAEYVAVKADFLAKKPDNVSFEEAAVVPMAALTAWQPLVYGMQIKEDDKILIHAGSGGVGHFAIQIAKYFGAKVIATSSAQNRDFVMSLGADQHIDYRNKNFWEVTQDIDFVFDTVGGDTLMHSIEVTKPGGTIISILGLADENLKTKAKAKHVNLNIWGMQPKGEDLRTIADLISKGVLKPYISKVYPFTAMVDAHTQIESNRTVGKIVVKV